MDELEVPFADSRTALLSSSSSSSSSASRAHIFHPRPPTCTRHHRPTTPPPSLRNALFLLLQALVEPQALSALSQGPSSSSSLPLHHHSSAYHPLHTHTHNTTPHHHTPTVMDGLGKYAAPIFMGTSLLVAVGAALRQQAKKEREEGSHNRCVNE